MTARTEVCCRGKNAMLTVCNLPPPVPEELLVNFSTFPSRKHGVSGHLSRPHWNEAPETRAALFYLVWLMEKRNRMCYFYQR